MAGPAVVVGRCGRRVPPHHRPYCTKNEEKNFKSVCKGLKHQIFFLSPLQLNNYVINGVKTDVKGPKCEIFDR